MPLKDDLRRPINLIFLAIAVVSLGFAAFAYLKGRPRQRALAYTVAAAAKVFDADVSSPKIRVLDDQERLIEDTIYLSVLTLWNSGELPIEPEDMRTPLSRE